MSKTPGAGFLHLNSEPSWVWDLDRARVVKANAAALDLWNEPSVADLMDREFDDGLSGDLRSENLCAGSEPATRVLAFSFPGGARTMECSLAHHALKDGRSGLLVTVLGDASTGTSQQVARLAMAAQNAPIALLVLDVGGRVLSENEAAENLFGLKGKGDLSQRLGSNQQAMRLIEETLVQGRSSKTCPIQTRIGPRLARLTARRGEEPSTGRPTILVQAVDVQDQRAREAELQDENAALQDFLDAGSDFYLEVDQDLRITRLSAEIAKQLGDGAQLGSHWRELVADHGLDPSNEIEFALGARSGWQDQSLTIQRGEEETHFSSSARALSNDKGDFRGYRIIGREVAAARATAQVTQLATADGAPMTGPLNGSLAGPAAHHSTDFADVLNAAPWAVIIHRDFQPLYINVAFTELVTLPDEALNTPGDLDLFYYFPQAQKALVADYDQLMEEDLAFAVRDLNIRRKDGQVLQAQLRARAITWGGKPAVEYIIEDVSIQQRQRRAQEQRAEVMTCLLDVVPEAVFLLDSTGRIDWTNKGCRDILGLAEKSPDPHDLSDVLSPDDAEWAKDYVAGLAEGGLTRLFAKGREVTVINAKGEPVPAMLALDRIDTGFAIKICAVLRDLSDWKRNQIEAAEVSGDAENSSARKTAFLANVSHELRTPLTAILGFAEVMSKEEYGPLGNPRYVEYAQDIVSSGDLLLSLVDDLLDMSKVEAGKLDLSFDSVDLQQVTDSCVKLMTSVASGREINLHAIIPENLSSVVADERSLRQIILNLISNALRFTEPGGEVQVSVAPDDAGGLTLAVADTGVGMTEEELAIALEPFEQVDKAVANGTPGSGLGLPLARALTEANRAYFRIISEPQTGTTVAITFPSTQVLADF